MDLRCQFILLFLGVTVTIAQKCSPFCTCDMWKDLQRTLCTNKNLVDIVSDVPQRVEVLDLSFNSIRIIEDNSFQMPLRSLKQLNLSRNYIQHIGMKAFYGLNQLKIMDLSNNAIKYLLNGIFLETSQLETLILSGNDFSRTTDAPLLEAPLLKLLYLSQCHFDHIKSNALTKIPSIEGLDLSGNYLAQLDLATLSHLQKLQRIDLSRNRWHCNNKTKELTNWLIERNVEYTPICTGEKQSDNNTEFTIESPDDDIEMIPDSKLWPNGDREEEMNGKLKIQNQCEPTNTEKEDSSYFWYITHLFDVIPSFWAFVMGFEVGAAVSMFGTLLVVVLSRRSSHPLRPVHQRWSLRRSVRMLSTGSDRNQWTELQSLDCPDTPPPAYKDISIPLNNMRPFSYFIPQT